MPKKMARAARVLHVGHQQHRSVKDDQQISIGLGGGFLVAIICVCITSDHARFRNLISHIYDWRRKDTP